MQTIKVTTSKNITHKYTLQYSRYINNQRIAILLINNFQFHNDMLIDDTGLAATVNVVDIPLSYNEVAIKNWGENEGILDALINENIVTKPHRQISINYVTINICYLIDSLIVLQNLTNRMPTDEVLKIQNPI